MVANADRGNSLEWEANDFAAELLMPRHVFAKDAARRDPAFREVGELASVDLYDVSITAAALRYVDVTSSACALISARNGRIEWVARSESFSYRIPTRGDELPSESVAAMSSEEAIGDLQPLDPYTWLELQQTREVEVFESTHVVPTQNQVLSLLWVVQEASWV
jgi:hypothetical protein